MGSSARFHGTMLPPYWEHDELCRMALPTPDGGNTDPGRYPTQGELLMMAEALLQRIGEDVQQIKRNVQGLVETQVAEKLGLPLSAVKGVVLL